MAFRRTHELWTYDVFPKVFETGKEAEIHIHYMGGRKSMSPEQTYEATVMWMSGSNGNYPATEYKRVIPFNGTEEGSFTVKVEPPRGRVPYLLLLRYILRLCGKRRSRRRLPVHGRPSPPFHILRRFADPRIRCIELSRARLRLPCYHRSLPLLSLSPRYGELQGHSQRAYPSHR